MSELQEGYQIERSRERLLSFSVSYTLMLNDSGLISIWEGFIELEARGNSKILDQFALHWEQFNTTFLDVY